MVMLLSGYRLSMGNNIDIVVVQLNNPHNKILPWASHILLVTACFIICCIILEIWFMHTTSKVMMILLRNIYQIFFFLFRAISNIFSVDFRNLSHVAWEGNFDYTIKISSSKHTRKCKFINSPQSSNNYFSYICTVLSLMK